jgi:predicted MPP superfamily phosphohydrolase
MKSILNKGIILIAGLLISQVLTGQFTHQLQGNKLPWTQTPQVKDNNFRFVIISDLTGGEKEGVFEAVIKKINQLAPDFVMCVGDLIDGYTIDSMVMKNQWKSFHKRISKLNAPFFYMPGNHDVANRMLYNEWIRQYGYDYYSFNVSGSLFIILNAYEDKQGELSDRQVQYVKKVLRDHDPENPVYLFSHPPLWDLKDKMGLNELWPLLNRNKTTFFCGDDHHYIMKEVEGHTHYMLSNTGGGFDEEKTGLGIFNHILWVTSTPEGLTIANILTDGIIPTDIVTNANEKQVYGLLRNNWFSIKPVYITRSTAGQFESDLSIRNNGDFPLSVTGSFQDRTNLKLIPDSFVYLVPAGETLTIPVTLINKGNYDVDDLPAIQAEVTGTYIQGERLMKNSFQKEWIIDNLKYCYPDTGEIKYVSCERPGFIEESWSWTGPADGSFKFTASFDKENIRIKITTSDDILIANSIQPDKPQDRIYINFSADTSLKSSDYLVIEMADGLKPVLLNDKKKLGSGVAGECSHNNNSLIANLSIPRKNLVNDFFRLNIGFRDQDDITSSDQSILWWKPEWGSGSDYEGAGMFRLKKE